MWFARSRDRRRGVILDDPLDDSPRCKECDGACCRAFPVVPLSWGEYECLLSLGAQRLLLTLQGDPYLVIDAGCEFLTEGRCSIYPDRPDICRRFACMTPDM